MRLTPLENLYLKKKILDHKILVILVFLPLFFILGIIGGYLFRDYSTRCENKFIYVNKVFNCGLKHVVNKSNLSGLTQKLNLYIESKQKSGEVSEVSVYFRDLEEGPTLGINDDELYFSASLLRLPIALVFFKLKEDVPDILEKEIDFKTTPDYKAESQSYHPSERLKEGSKYTIEQLIEHALIYSDNLAIDVLNSALGIGDKKLDLKVFRDLGLIYPTDNKVGDISTRGYASIFRILYNGAYLNIEDSNKVLSILSKSDFDGGITAGVPENVTVANKFGEIIRGEETQLHDCGIVYYPDNPYLICVMTRGKDFNRLEETIAQISRMVYEELDARRY